MMRSRPRRSIVVIVSPYALSEDAKVDAKAPHYSFPYDISFRFPRVVGTLHLLIELLVHLQTRLMDDRQVLSGLDYQEAVKTRFGVHRLVDAASMLHWQHSMYLRAYSIRQQ